MSELPNEAGVSVDTEQQQTAPVEPVENQNTAGSDLAPDSQQAGEDNSQKIDQDAVQKAINRQHFKYREEQRKAQELEARLKEAERKLNESSGDIGVSVDIPPLPDSWDEQYEAKIRARDEAIRRAAAVELQQQKLQEQATLEAQRKQQQELERTQTLSNQFIENASKLGVDERALSAASKTVTEYGVTPDVAAALLEDESGPLMVQYLAANPLDLYELVNSTPLTAGMRLAGVKQKAQALRPKKTGAPDPATQLNGRSAPVQERGPKGATYE